MKKIELLAQLSMDLFYRDYSKDSDFFKIEDFIEYCSMFYYQILQEEFDKSVIKNQKLYNNPMPTINDSWFTEREFEIKKEGNKVFIDIPTLFSFSNDKFISSIKLIEPLGDSCSKYIKITKDKAPGLKFLPKSEKSVFYYPLSDKIYFENLTCSKSVNSIKVHYISTLEESDENKCFSVPNPILSEIVTRCYNIFSTSRNGSVIDKTNDQNPNKLIQTEIAV